MNPYEIDTDSFELSFFEEPPFIVSTDSESNQICDDDVDEDCDDENEADPSEERERTESRIPKEAIYLGTIEHELENWTTWDFNDEYYLIKLQDSDFDWALFRLSWDDNWREWNLVGDARLKGANVESSMAARLLLEHVWSEWGIDYQRNGSPYQKIIKGI